jgi:hypothetical protein
MIAVIFAEFKESETQVAIREKSPSPRGKAECWGIAAHPTNIRGHDPPVESGQSRGAHRRSESGAIT